MPPKRNVVISTGASPAVKAYLDKVLSIRPRVRDTFMFYLALLTPFDFPISTRHNSLQGPLSLCGLLTAMSYSEAPVG